MSKRKTLRERVAEEPTDSKTIINNVDYYDSSDEEVFFV